MTSTDRFADPARAARLGSPADDGRDDSDPVMIEENIERTRAEMGETIDAIQSRLAPDRLQQEAKAAVREMTVGRIEQMAYQTGERAQGVRADLFTTIKQNPVPAALAAIGIGWLWTHRASDSQPRYGNGYGYDYRAGMSGGWNYTPSYPGAIFSGGYATGGYAPGAYATGDSGSERSRTDQLGETVQQMTGQAAHQMQERAGQVQEMASQIPARAGHMQHQVQQQAQGFWQMLEANPIAVGALGVVMGGIAGLILPETEREQQMMGETRDRVIGNVQQAASEAVDKVQRVAYEAGQTVQEAAKVEGMAG